MDNRISRYLWLFEQYVFNIPVYFFHEIMHWIFCFITWLFEVNSFPKIVITRWPKRYVNADDTTTTMSFSAHVNYIYHGRRWSKHLVICCAMPLFGLIALLYFSPWFMYLYYLPSIGTLWPSISDSRKIYTYFKIRKRHTSMKRKDHKITVQ